MTTRQPPWWILALFVATAACGGDDDDDSAGQGGAGTGPAGAGQAGTSAGGQAGKGQSGSSGQTTGGTSSGSSGASGNSGQAAGGQGGAAAGTTSAGGTSAGGASAGTTTAGGASGASAGTTSTGGMSAGGTSAGGTSAGGTSAGGTNAGGSDSGPLARIGSCGSKTGRYFPGASWMYQDITSAPVRGNSAATTQWLTDNKGWGLGRFQIDTSFRVLEASASTPRLLRTPGDPVEYSTDCDPGVEFPLPTGGAVEGFDDYVCPGRAAGDYNGDCHLIVADLINHKLFEAFRASYEGGKFYSECNVAWDMTQDWWGPRRRPARPCRR